MTRTGRRKPVWFTLLASAVLLAGYFGFHALFVKVGRSVEQPFSGPAKSNAYYVFQRYLEERGVPVRSVRNWPQPLPRGALVLWFSDEDVPADLKAWVSAGGQLWAERDPDLPLPVAYAWTRTPFATDKLTDDADADGNDGDEPTGTCDECGLAAAQFHYGAGYLTLVDGSALQNDAIASGDTPARIDALLGVSTRPRVALFVTQFGSPWFGALLLSHAPQALFALAALLVLSLWRAGSHFGASLPPPPSARRQMLEHVVAVGTFASRMGLAPLITAARRELQRQVQLRVPHGAGLGAEAFISAVASAMNLPAADVQRALLEPFHGDGQQAIAIARAMQALWRKT